MNTIPPTTADDALARAIVYRTLSIGFQAPTDDRLDARFLGEHGEFKRAEQIGPVGQGHGRHLGLGGQIADLLGLDRAFQQGIGGADPQVDETLVHRVAHLETSVC